MRPSEVVKAGEEETGDGAWRAMIQYRPQPRWRKELIVAFEVDYWLGGGGSASTRAAPTFRRSPSGSWGWVWGRQSLQNRRRPVKRGLSVCAGGRFGTRSTSSKTLHTLPIISAIIARPKMAAWDPRAPIPSLFLLTLVTYCQSLFTALDTYRSNRRLPPEQP